MKKVRVTQGYYHSNDTNEVGGLMLNPVQCPSLSESDPQPSCAEFDNRGVETCDCCEGVYYEDKKLVCHCNWE